MVLISTDTSKIQNTCNTTVRPSQISTPKCLSVELNEMKDDGDDKYQFNKSQNQFFTTFCCCILCTVKLCMKEDKVVIK